MISLPCSVEKINQRRHCLKKNVVVAVFTLKKRSDLYPVPSFYYSSRQRNVLMRDRKQEMAFFDLDFPIRITILCDRILTISEQHFSI